jgi:cell division protein ZapA
MAEVDIMVNERLYRVTCDDGQEKRLERLASHFDGRVRRIVEELGQIGDARLMLLAALTVCDELLEARNNLAEIGDGAAALDPETIGGATRVLEAAANRIDGLAGRLQSA